MPTSIAIVRSWAVARMALPIRVNLISQVRRTITTAVVSRIIRSDEPIIPAIGSINAKSGTNWGKGMKSDVWASST